VILKGTDESDNPYGANNISIARDLDYPNLNLIDLADQLGPTDSEADCKI
jgi:hypothetical protein